MTLVVSCQTEYIAIQAGTQCLRSFSAAGLPDERVGNVLQAAAQDAASAAAGTGEEEADAAGQQEGDLAQVDNNPSR